ncbi:uncharacterized protein [Musca autumnalis]|uniref:uncharacterized protein n=1 Tax=Musca autumnalis TaxID=221902 RepID=UPI003CEA3795
MFKYNLTWLLLLILISFFYSQVLTVPTKCALTSSCVNSSSAEPLCMLDEQNGCIRQYASKCHLDIDACVQGKNFTDYSNLYCMMDTYLCEGEYERWTIFFGHEK